MLTIMEDCQSAAIQLTTEQQQSSGLISGGEIHTQYRATVNCPMLEYRGQAPQTGEAERAPVLAIYNLGETMGMIACNKCPISRMDMRQAARYLADVAIERAVVQELIERGDLPENWHP